MGPQKPKNRATGGGRSRDRPLDKLTQFCEEIERHHQLPISEDSAGLILRRALIAPDSVTVGAQEFFITRPATPRTSAGDSFVRLATSFIP
jgi:hypothetical protein